MSKHRLIISIGLSVLLVVWIIRFAANHLGHADEIKGHTVPATQGPTSLVRALRPNYPYSVIPGGAYSQGELQYAHGKDNLVRSHYSDFDVKNARLVNLTEDRFQYVSYRLKDQIYWTKRKLRIPKGELLLTDGVHYARTRCGNRLSAAPHQAATSPNEPDPKVLSLPPVTPEMLPKMALATPPSLGDPPVVPLVDSHTAAPVSDPGLPAVQPVLPEGPILTGFAPAPYSGVPIVATGGGTPPTAPATPAAPTTPTTPATPPPTNQPPTTTPPATTPPATTPPANPPPVEVVPVPEPSTIYFFLLIGVIVSVFAILRMGPKDNQT